VQFLFTAGMTLVDSLDSILMLYSYAGFPERTFKIIEKVSSRRTKKMPKSRSEDIERLAQTVGGSRGSLQLEDPIKSIVDNEGISKLTAELTSGRAMDSKVAIHDEDVVNEPEACGSLVPDNVTTSLDFKVGLDNDDRGDAEDAEFVRRRKELVKQNMMSGLSIILTLISILAAFRFAGGHPLIFFWRSANLKNIAYRSCRL